MSEVMGRGGFLYFFWLFPVNCQQKLCIEDELNRGY